jgi:hypothetical protein
LDSELKRRILETLYYHLGMLNVLIKNAKKRNHTLYQQYIEEKNKVEKIIEDLNTL